MREEAARDLLVAGSKRSDRSVVSMVGTRLRDASKASGIVAAAPLATHWCAPAGLLESSHSKPNRFSKKLLLHLVGVVVQVTSRPLVIASAPLPVPKLLFQPKPEPRCCRLRARHHVRGRTGAWPCRSCGRRSGRPSLVVHRHAARSRGCRAPRQRIRMAVGPRVHIDQPICTAPSGFSSCGRRRARVAEPFRLGAP